MNMNVSQMKQILDEVDIINQQVPILEKICEMLISSSMTLKMHITGENKNLHEPSAVRFDDDGSLIATPSFLEKYRVVEKRPDFEMHAELLEEEAVVILKFMIEKKRNRRNYLKTLFENK